MQNLIDFPSSCCTATTKRKVLTQKEIKLDLGDVNSQKRKENKNPNQHIVIVEDDLKKHSAMQYIFKRHLFTAIHFFPICLSTVTSITETQNALEATSQHSHPQK